MNFRIWFNIVVAILSAPSLFVNGQSDYAAALVQALNDAQLTTLATLLSSAPAALVSALESGNHTVFAPTNDALSDVPPGLSPDVLANVLAYHVLAGQLDPNAVTAGQHAVVRTTLAGAPEVLLSGNQTQVIAVTKNSNGRLVVLNGDDEVTVSSNATFRNLQVQVIDEVLSVPGNLSTTVRGAGQLSSLAEAVQSASPDLLRTLERTVGVTIFAPVNDAFTAAAASLGSANQTTALAVLANHIINGTAVYSSQVADGATAISAGGQQFKFNVNSTGAFVTSGPSSAQIIRTDILVSNGVVHLINGILLNTASDPDAAASAVASASSAQATATGVATGPVSGAAAPTGTTTGQASILHVSAAVFAIVFMTCVVTLQSV